MKHVFVVNPVAGKKDPGITLELQLARAGKELGADCCVLRTKAKGHAAELCRKMAQEAKGEAIRFYAVGGDGTLNEVITGVYESGNLQAEAASVPCGSGNDFVRNFGTAEDFLDLADNIRGAAVPIDLMRTNHGLCAAISSAGVDAEVAYGIPKFRRIPFCGGSMAYNLSIAQCMCHKLGNPLRVELDGRVLEDNYLIVTLCNGQRYGGGYQAAPTADLQDGMLEVVLVKKISRLRIVGVLAKYKDGKHIADGEVIPELRDIMSYHHAKQISITALGERDPIITVDGECGPARLLTADVLPLAVRFVLPQKLYSAWQGLRCPQEELTAAGAK